MQSPPPPPPPHSELFRVRICSYPLFESTPYLRTANISEPPFRGLFAGFSCLGDPPKSGKMLNVPPKYGIISQESKEMREKKKNTPFLKKSPGEKSNTPLFFYNSRAGLCRTKSTPLPDILATRMRSFRPLSGGGGGGGGRDAKAYYKVQLTKFCNLLYVNNWFLPNMFRECDILSKPTSKVFNKGPNLISPPFILQLRKNTNTLNLQGVWII